MTSKISKVVGEPLKVLKKTGKELIKPAGKENVYAVAVGVAISPLVSWGYGKFYDYVMKFFPNIPNWLKVGLKIVLPLLPTPIVKMTKIPMGNVINGGLFGVFFLQVFMLIYEMITGKALSPKTSDTASEDYTVSADTNGFADF